MTSVRPTPGPGAKWAALCLAACAMTWLLAGCNALPRLPGLGAAPAQPSAASPSPSSPSAADVALSEGIALYDKGDFAGAIRRLGGAKEIRDGDKADQVLALKYMAFSYCVTRRPVACRHAFEQAFRIDPDFDLAPGEKGHPLWTPAFERARATAKTAAK